MSAVVGIDLSTKALDLVKLDEDTNRAAWVRCELPGKDAWERTLGVRKRLLVELRPVSSRHVPPTCWWDDVYLVAIEAPYGFGSDILNRVVGAVAASLPAQLQDPARCWIVRPDEWKKHHGLSAKPSVSEFRALSGGHPGSVFGGANPDVKTWQNAMDAFCLAMYARDTNAKAIEEAA